MLIAFALAGRSFPTASARCPNPSLVLIVRPNISISRYAVRLRRSIFLIHPACPISGPFRMTTWSPSTTPSDTPMTRCPFSVKASIHATSRGSKGMNLPSLPSTFANAGNAPERRLQVGRVVGHHDQVAGEQHGRAGAPRAANVLLHLVARHEALAEHPVAGHALDEPLHSELPSAITWTTYHTQASSPDLPVAFQSVRAKTIASPLPDQRAQANARGSATAIHSQEADETHTWHRFRASRYVERSRPCGRMQLPARNPKAGRNTRSSVGSWRCQRLRGNPLIGILAKRWNQVSVVFSRSRLHVGKPLQDGGPTLRKSWLKKARLL